MNKKSLSIITIILSITIIFSSCTLLEKIPFLNKNKYGFPDPGEEVSGTGDQSVSEESSLPENNVETENETMPEDIDDILDVDGSDKEIPSDIFDLLDEEESSEKKTSTESSSSGSSQSKQVVSNIVTNNTDGASSSQEKNKSESSVEEKTKSNTDTKVASSSLVSAPKAPPEKTDPSKTPMIEDVDLDERLTELSNEIFYLINLERTEAGLSALETDPLLTTAAGIRANEASQYPDLAHDRPDGTKCHTVLEEVEYSKKGLVMGENLVFTVYDATAEKLVDLWRNSEGHRNNYMEPSYKYSGLAIYYSSDAKFALTCAQIFAN